MEHFTWGHSSKGIPMVAPSGWVEVGEFGEADPCCIFLNCLATLPLHVVDFGDGNWSKAIYKTYFKTNFKRKKVGRSSQRL